MCSYRHQKPHHSYLLLLQLKVGKVTNLAQLEKNKVMQQTVDVDGESLEADLVISCVGKVR